MDDVVSRLVSLGLSKAEAIVYINLLQNNKSTGYKISQSTNLSRASVYQALDSLYSKGIIYLTSSQAKEYTPKSPKVLLKELEQEYVDSISFLDKKLDDLQYQKEHNYFFNIEGHENIMSKLKEMIASANEEIYISSNFGVEYLREEFIGAIKRGVKIIFYSPIYLETDLDIDLSCRGGFDSVVVKNTRLIAVIDEKESLIFDNGETDPIGVFSTNKLFSKILTEHIHHDIYIARLIKKHGEIITDDIQVHSKHEKSFKDIILELQKVSKSPN